MQNIYFGSGLYFSLARYTNSMKDHPQKVCSVYYGIYS